MSSISTLDEENIMHIQSESESETESEAGSQNQSTTESISDETSTYYDSDDYNDDDDSEFENDSCYDECMDILDYEANHIIDTFQNHTYYIGSYIEDPSTIYNGSNALIILLSITTPTFFAHDAKPILFYMKNYNGFSSRLKVSIEILKIECITIVDGTFSYTIANVIVKTFWIKIIQRKWKSIYKKRMMAIQSRGTPHAIRYYQIHGKYPYGLNQLPGLYGMMADF
jgi:hypothetical protein